MLRAARARPGRPATLKGAGDYVTETDRACEEAILEVLARATPGVAVLAEEAGGELAPTMWAVDPLDGTTNFIHGLPEVAVSVGLLDAGEPVLGVVIAPYLGLEFAAARGHGAALNGTPLHRLRAVDCERAVVATGFPFRHKERMARYLPVMEAALLRFEDLRRAGAAALDLAWTGAGSLDGFFELGLHPWDVAAGAAIVLESGGRVTDWQGGQGWIESGDILAAPAAVHEVLLELAAQAPDR